MSLRAEILARIDETPHRPPTYADLLRAVGPYEWALQADLDTLQTESVIDTEHGDSGLTYRRAKVYATAKPAPVPVYATCEGITQWPKPSRQKQSLNDNSAAKNRAQVKATKAKMRKALAAPLTVAEYADAVGTSKTSAQIALARYVDKGFLRRIGKRPFKYRVRESCYQTNNVR